MASNYIRKTVNGDGSKRWSVKYRVGGSNTPLQHAGTFKRYAEALIRQQLVAEQLAAGSTEIRLTKMPAPVANSWVYFLQQGNDGPIKIGVARHPAKRLPFLQIANPYPLKLLGVIPHYGTEEKQLHSAFEQHRMQGEWFRPAPEILQFIREAVGEDHFDGR